MRQFPFGGKLKNVIQTDRGPKKVFILGVYASAVHARWVGENGKEKVRALAVASEPCIFWRGDREEAEKIISRIDMPPGLGRLVPAAPKLNGPSGRALDELYLKRLALDRSDAWLCDLVPHACMNNGQAAALAREYEPIRAKYGLNEVTVPGFSPNDEQLFSAKRAAAILAELEESQARLIVTLGDLPIRHFINRFAPAYKKLTDLVPEPRLYGRKVKIQINQREYCLLPLVHMQHAGMLGKGIQSWAETHQAWMAGKNGKRSAFSLDC